MDLGFDRPDYVETGVYEEFVSNYSKVIDRRGKRWEPVMKDGSPSKGYRMKRFIRKGIPPEHRAKVWMLMSGADRHQKANTGIYKSLLQVTPDKANMEVIEADVPRTFPENVFFRNGDDPKSKMASLTNILKAFTVKNPEIGYCQGLNYVGAVLLLIIENEESAFWLLNTLVIEIIPGYYQKDMLGVQVDCMVLEMLIKDKIPPVHDLLTQAGTSCILLCTKWFVCLFADVLPVETTLRVFDCLFYEGDKILFRVALTLIKMNQSRLMACTNFPQVVTTFKEIVQDRSALFCHEFILNLFKLPGSLSKKKLAKLRHESTEKILAERPERHRQENGDDDD